MTILAMLRLAVVTILFLVYSSHGRTFPCTGGPIYFAAHPADVLLYQNPDIFRNLYVFKCTTAVLFTSGDRGIVGNYSRSLERGLEEAFSYMAGQPANETAWTGTRIQIDGKVVPLRWLKESPNVSLLYLRLPNSRSGGQAYGLHKNRGTLKKLYSNESKTVTTTDASATYTLDSLKSLISVVLKNRKPSEINILNVKSEVDDNSEHADHSVSARLVMEVMKRNNITATLRSYAGGCTHNLRPTLNDSSMNFGVKLKAFFEYAKHDPHMCEDYQACLHASRKGVGHSTPGNDDLTYVADWLQREYYVQV